MIKSYRTATNWDITYDPQKRQGRAARDGKSAPFEVTGTGLVLFRTEDAVPGATVSGVQHWITNTVLKTG